MNEFSAQIFDELDRYTPEPDRWPDWGDVVQRARKQRTHRLVVALAAAVIVLGSATAVTAALGGFDSWLSGTPGKPAPKSEQERFDASNRSLNSFPKGTKLRELVRADVGGKQYELYGFRSGASVCLRLKAVSLGHSIGPTCAPVSKVKRATAPVVVVVGNGGFQNRHGRPSASVSFGIAADGVSRVEVRAVDGVHRAALGGNAYLWVDNNPNTGQHVSSVTAVRAGGSRITVPLSGGWGFYSADAAPERPPRGPADVQVKIPHPTVGWFVRNERRGFSLGEVRKGLPKSTSLYTNGLESTRLVKPDPLSNALVGLTGRWCLIVYQRGGTASSCTPGREFWSLGPLNVLLSGEGDEFVRISGVAADGVEHVTVFLASGERQRAAFKDNLFTTLVPAAEFPARIVAYNRRDRVVGVLTWRWQMGGPVPAAAVRNLPAVMRVTGPNDTTAIARVGRRVRGYRCWRVDLSSGQSPGGCLPRIGGGPALWVDAVQPGGRDLFVIGHVFGAVERVRLEFTNGDVIRTRPVRGLFVMAIPREHLRSERQLAFAVGYTAEGKRVQKLGFVFKIKP
jgi:hypothetical protein